MRFIKNLLMIIGGGFVVLFVIALFNGGTLEFGTTPQSSQQTTSTTPAKTPAGYKEYSEKDRGYTINYPTDWTYEKPNDYTVLFSGKQGDEAYDVTFNVQNLLPADAGGKYGSAQDVTSSLKNQIGQAQNVTITETDTFDFVGEDGSKIQGQMFSAAYTVQNTDFKQLQMVIPRADGRVFYALAFTAPANLYEKYTTIKSAMVASFEMLK